MNLEYEKIVGKAIRKYRTERNITQEQLSARLQISGCDITRSALAKIEAGQRHIYIDELKQIVEILRIEYRDLLD
ncbi:MAG: helix-turn-helix transcriptional regulator [Clostridia bacterium]